MKNYFSIENKLYTLTNKQVKELKKLYPEDNPDNWADYLSWIENNGKYLGSCQNLAY